MQVESANGPPIFSTMPFQEIRIMIGTRRSKTNERLLRHCVMRSARSNELKAMDVFGIVCIISVWLRTNCFSRKTDEHIFQCYLASSRCSDHVWICFVAIRYRLRGIDWDQPSMVDDCYPVTNRFRLFHGMRCKEYRMILFTHTFDSFPHLSARVWV